MSDLVDPGSACHYCGSTTSELRPYGPGGADVCFRCAMATPEREAQAAAAFGVLLDSAEAIAPSGVVAIGTEAGPVPFDPRQLGRPRGDHSDG